MVKLFPTMTSRPEPGYPFFIFAYWVIAFIGLPLLSPILAVAFGGTITEYFWTECVYYIINAAVLFFIMREYLIDGFLEVQINPKAIFLTVAATVGMMLISIIVSALALAVFSYSPWYILDSLPLVEMTVLVSPGRLVVEHPLIATLLLSVVVPFGICGLFYVPGFAPICCKKPWLAYLVMIFVLFLPVLFDILWRGEPWHVLLIFAIRLPIHLLACWSYQKTDCIWTAIFSVGAVNLIMSLVNMLFS